MENLPVPKNVLDVEFKLFGALTVKQFFKVLVGCVGGVLFFLLPIHILVRIPLMAGAVILGVGAALLPGFEVKVSKLVKHIFVSPRYFWKKSVEAPEVLKMSAPKPVKQDISVPTDDVSIDELLETRATQLLAEDKEANRGTTVDADENNKLDMLMSDVYKDTATSDGTLTIRRSSGTKEVGLGADAVPSPVDMTAQVEMKPEEKGVSVAKLEQSMMSGDMLTKVEAGDQIEGMYKGVKEGLGGISSGSVTEKPKTNIFGIVVDKAGNPLSGVVVEARSIDGNVLASGRSGNDGRFSLELSGDVSGMVVLRPTHSNYKFAQFKVNIGGNKLPGFKLRAS